MFKFIYIYVMIKLFEEFNSSIDVFKGINRSEVNYTYGGVNDDGIGQFYTDNIVMAKWFAGLTDYDVDVDRYVDIDGDGEVITQNIQIDNPYIIRGEEDNEDVDSVQVYFNEIKSNGGVVKYRNSLIKRGYDGIIVLNGTTNYYEDGTYTIYVVF
jgi:hypothetical protein